MKRRRFMACIAASLASASSGRWAAADEGGIERRERIARIFRGWDRISDHRTGSPGDRRTAKWLGSWVHRNGAASELSAFPFRRRVVRHAYLEVDGRRIEGLPLFDGGETDGVVAAPLTPDAGAREIALVTFTALAAPGGNQALVDARQAGRSAGIVAVASDDRLQPGLAVLNAEDYLKPFGPPVLQVGSEHRSWLHQAADARRPARLRIQFREEDSKAFNVATRVTGRQPTLAPVVVITPRSGWWRCTSERGGGIAVWLEAIRELTLHPPLRPVLFTANTGHELGHLGMNAFIEAQPQLVRDAFAWVHLGANFAARDSELVLQGSSAPLLDLALAAFRHNRVEPARVVPPQARPFGEARDIFDGGGQYVSLLGSNRLFHHPDDRWPDAVDLARATSIANALVYVIRSLADSPASAA